MASERLVKLCVACSIDGYIAGPNEEIDWLYDPADFDFGAFFGSVDTVVMGRRSYEVLAGGGNGGYPGLKTIVVSRTLRQRDYPDVTILAEKPEEALTALRAESGKDIWLFGGGLLFRSLAQAGLVDGVEVAVIPVLLGGGIPLLAPPATETEPESGTEVVESPPDEQLVIRSQLQKGSELPPVAHELASPTFDLADLVGEQEVAHDDALCNRVGHREA